MRAVNSTSNRAAVRQDEMACIGGRLLEKRHFLVRLLQAEMLQIDEPVGLPKDSADAACSTSTREALYQLGAVEAGAIAEIDHALEKIDEGTYGTCETCGKRISAARLKAIPSTCLCLACKRRQEARARARAEEAYSEPWRLASALDAEQAGEDSPELSVVAVRGRPNAA